MPIDEQLTDPYGSFYFSLEINGIEVGHFEECSGLKSTATVFEIEEGGLNGYTHKRPGLSKWENITLKYATSTSVTLLELRDEFVRDQYSARLRNSGAIVMYNNLGEEIRRYSFAQCWPVSWEGPSVNAGNSELAIETVELAHDGLTISGKPGKPAPGAPPPRKKRAEPKAKKQGNDIIVMEPIQFDYDSYKVKATSQDTLDEVAKILKENPEMEIEIGGHTSSEGSDAYNQELSEKRAEEVRRELRNRGVADDRMTTKGYGESEPVADNGSIAGRSKNRRVTFTGV